MKLFTVLKELSVILNEKRYLKILKIGLVLGLIIFSLFFSDCYLSYKNEIKKIEQSSANLSSSLEQQLNSTFNVIEIVLSNLQEKITKIYLTENKLNIEEIKKELEKDISNTRDTLAIRLYDHNGEFLIDSKGTNKKVNISDREYFQTTKVSNSNILVISKPIFSKITSTWVMTFTKKIEDKNKKFIGVLSATIELDTFSNKFQKLEIGPNKLVSLYSLENINYFRIPKVDSIIGNKVDELKFEDFNLKDKFIQFIDYHHSPVDGVLRVVARTKFSNYPFVVSVGISLLDGLKSLMIRTLSNFVILIISFSMFIIFMIRYLYSEIQLVEERKHSLQASKLSSLGEMASGIAHEINNPLAIIQSSIASLTKHLKSQNVSDEKILNNLDRVSRNTTRIAKIVRGLRNFSRDSYNDPFEKVSTEKIISEVLDISFERFRHQGIELIVENDIPHELIECRYIQIGQVLLNLLNNSFDAISEQQSDKWVKLKIAKKDQHVLFYVIDSGKGIKSDVAEKIMDPFFTTKAVGKGTGLGLSISRGIVENHHGKLNYVSGELNTTFVLELPVLHNEN